ncbi:hypothetical protein F1880_000831 [Penicillium rolfsii]|nr:hypothetical protein F1880_000831 [Penicillium rolfsii]
MIARTLSLHSLSTFVRELFNTFVDSAGGDPLFARSHKLVQRDIFQSSDLSLLAPILLGTLLTFLIRYIIGHVLMSIAILDNVEMPAGVSDLGKKDTTGPPLSRRIVQTISALHHNGGFRVLVNGMGYALVYWGTRFFVEQVLSILLPEMASYIFASIATAEIRFFWLASTILAPGQLDNLSINLNYRRWQSLILPNMLHATAQALILYISAVLNSGYTPQIEDLTTEGAVQIVRSDIFVSALMLCFQLLLLVPSKIVLVLVQASLLPPACDTLVIRPSRKKQFVSVGEIFPGGETRPLQTTRAVQSIGTGIWLACLQVSAKMWLCLLVITSMVQ